MARALTEAGVIFQYQVIKCEYFQSDGRIDDFKFIFQTYADEGHELSNVIEHVYRSMEHYLRDCLSLDSDETKPSTT